MHLDATLRRRVADIVKQWGPRYEALQSEWFWSTAMDMDISWQHRHAHALGIFDMMLEMGVLGLDPHTFKHLTSWVQQHLQWTTDVTWLCIENFSCIHEPNDQMARWVCLDDVLDGWRPPDTGHPGTDWNTVAPTASQIANGILTQDVVLLKDLHFRIVPVVLTLKGHPLEPQPPRVMPVMDSQPPDTTWDYVSGVWRQVYPRTHPLITNENGMAMYAELITITLPWMR